VILHYFCLINIVYFVFFFQAEDGIRDRNVTGVQTCALPIFTSNIQQTEHGNYLAIEPQVQEKIIKNIAKEVEKASLQNEQLVVLCSPTIRKYVKQLLERNLPQVAVLSNNELDPDVQVQSVGVLNVT